MMRKINSRKTLKILKNSRKNCYIFKKKRIFDQANN